MRNSTITIFTAWILLTASAVAEPPKRVRKSGATKATPATRIRACLWQSPRNIAARDLFYGSGGRERQPHGTFTFVRENLGGSSPKFVIRDQDGAEWKVKLGSEARAETAATRLIWAAGYYTDEDYIVPVLR